MMGNDEENPIFHDFLGTSREDTAKIRVTEARASASPGASSGGHGLLSTSSDLGSERQAANSLEGVQFHGLKSDLSGAEINKGKKRSNSDSAFMGSVTNRLYQMGPDSLKSGRLLKMLQNEAGGEQARSSHEKELAFAMQPPRPNSTSPLIRQPLTSSRPELVIPSWDRSISLNMGPVMHHPSRLGQFTTYVEKPSSDRLKDVAPGTSLISQPAADEGSRTGMKGSGILNIANTSSSAAERNQTGAMLSSNRSKAGLQNLETSNPPSCRSLASITRQMTIFYAGQAHVFDDVHPNKADAIMSLAGSSGGSWSTTYSSKSYVHPPRNESHVRSSENEMGIKNTANPQDIHGRLSTMETSNGLSQDRQIAIRGGHQSIKPASDTRIVAQPSEPNTEAKERYDRGH